MATVVDGDVKLAPLTGEARSFEEWVTTFHLALVVLDPYTYESAWILPTAGRILRVYADADCRTAFLLTCDAKDARRFLGPWVDELLVFTDPDRAAVKAMGLEALPAFVHVDQARTVAVKAEGWNPEEWRAVAQNLSTRMSWGAPTIPETSDPAPFAGTPALG